MFDICIICDLTAFSGFMMSSSNGNIFRVTGPLCGELTGHRWIPPERPVTRSFDVFFDRRLNKRLSEPLWSWWSETPSRSLRRHCNVMAHYIIWMFTYWLNEVCGSISSDTHAVSGASVSIKMALQSPDPICRCHYADEIYIVHRHHDVKTWNRLLHYWPFWEEYTGITNGSIHKHLAPVPLSIFRSNSKFDENSECSSFEYTRPITTIFCTRHDSDTVVTCAKYRCDRPRILYTRVFWIFIEFRIRSKYA